MSNINVIINLALPIIVCLFFGLPTTVLASPWEFTQSGKVSEGIDYGGHFFIPNTLLEGKSFSITYIVDPENYSKKIDAFNPYVNIHSGIYSRDTVLIIATLDGVSNEFIISPNKDSYGESQLSNMLSYSDAGIDRVSQFHGGALGGTGVSGHVQASSGTSSSLNKYNISLNYDQFWEHFVQPGDSISSSFELLTKDGGVRFTGAIEGMSFTIKPYYEAPEPSSFLLFAVGLFGVFYCLRRNRSGALCDQTLF